MKKKSSEKLTKFFDKNSTSNFGRFRLKDPKEFSRLWTRHDSNDKGISYVVGTLKGDGKYATQNIMFNRSLWTERKALSWWNKNKSRFTLKVRKKNPNKSLQYYLDRFGIKDIHVINKREKERIKFYIDHSLDIYPEHENIGSLGQAEIYVCYLEIPSQKLLIGIIEIYPDHIEYHTFDNQIKEIDLSNEKVYPYKLCKILFDYLINNL